MIVLRQSTASQEIPLGHFVDDTDGKTAETGLTIANTDIKIWKTGATTLASKNSGGATHISGGVYYAVLDATDTDTVGPMTIFVAVSGALAVRVPCIVYTTAMFDWMFAAVVPLDAAGIRTAVGLATANLDTQLTTIDDFLDTEVAAIKAKTDNLPASPAAVGSAMTLTSGERNSIADAALDRDMSTGADNGSSTVRTMRQALRFLRNKWSISGTTLTVTKEDDSTESWHSTVTATAGADPITANNPEGGA